MMERISAAQRRELTRVARLHSVGVKRAERIFTADIRAIMRGMHSAIMAFIEPSAKALTADAVKVIKDVPGKPSGNVISNLDKATNHVIQQVAPKVKAAHEKLTGLLAKNYTASMESVMPVGWKQLAEATQAEALRARDESIALVENAGRVYAQQVRDIFNDPSVAMGVRWEELRDQLLERADVSESRAELIARDQTLKLNGAIAKANQTGVGISKYVWSTSLDERVRDTHKELEGKIFDWDKPPKVGHPGEDFQCRCIAMPIFDDNLVTVNVDPGLDTPPPVIPMQAQIPMPVSTAEEFAKAVGVAKPEDVAKRVKPNTWGNVVKKVKKH